MIILGIESSCDETAAAVVKDGRTVLSSVVSSQAALHHPYGGVVPELASRKHIEAIVPVAEEAVNSAGLRLDQLQALAVTQGPGLIGSLLVGFTFAKGLAYALDIPWVGIDHLEGHIQALFLSSDPPPFPFVVLLASGGHTGLYHVASHTEFALMGQTRDDAAGEAYDKVAKMLDLGYPGGHVIDELAARGNPSAILFPRPYLDKSAFDFSFSGLKSAVSRYIHTHRDSYRDQINDIAAGFQEAIVEVLCFKLVQAARVKNCNHIAIAGGVAANQRLRKKIRDLSITEGLFAHIPEKSLCGDNAAMIATAGFHHLKAGRRAAMSDDVYSRSAPRLNLS
ncbi:MAG: tRNA (adenosine(37)-N6)-threonylcarbamoyltransferase complex transferase subunit TsaD [Thermodesulfobacteriota bacterium]